ncbi:MAG: dihydrofolate reductase [Bacteroidales bacterium]|nr:dihydrofolate reductase [Bacteroidales bacterium]
MKKIFFLMSIVLLGLGCNSKQADTENFNYKVDRFADVEIIRYQVPGFEYLSLRQKKLVYYLSEAALWGRDIIYDQNYRHNLLIRQCLEAIYQHAGISRQGEDWQAFEIYLKRLWVANGIHHHYSSDKFAPGFSKEFIVKALKAVPADKLPCLPLGQQTPDQNQAQTPEHTESQAQLASQNKQLADELAARLLPLLFDAGLDAKRVNQAQGEDLVLSSACNFYRDVTQKEAEAFYEALNNPDDTSPVSYGLNSRLVKEEGQLREKIWKIGGLYSTALENIVHWLELAKEVAENDRQKDIIQSLIDYYHSGDLKTFDQYSILWVQDLQSQVDFVNGFIESYGDPLGIKGSWEAIVNFKNEEASKRTQIISDNAQWFEDHAPINDAFRKKQVKGVSAKVITNAIMAGDAYPTTAIGINLPNANWIRRDYGSKSVTIENITEAYFKSSQGSGFNEEFMWSNAEIEASARYGFVTGNLHTDLHECLGHGSGQLLPGVDPNALRSYGSVMEEARADLFALYFLADPKLVELGLVPDAEAYKAEYYEYMMNGLLSQLTRIEPGGQIEESHMRNRALIARWLLDRGSRDKVMELKKRHNKTYLLINDYEALRQLTGQLLAEVQRIKSEGDYPAAQTMVENYAVQVDPQLHQEILDRYAKLNLSPYKGFVNPIYKPVYNNNNEIVDITVHYDENYVEQHLRYSKDYAALPLEN